MREHRSKWAYGFIKDPEHPNSSQFFDDLELEEFDSPESTKPAAPKNAPGRKDPTRYWIDGRSYTVVSSIKIKPKEPSC